MFNRNWRTWECINFFSLYIVFFFSPFHEWLMSLIFRQSLQASTTNYIGTLRKIFPNIEQIDSEMFAGWIFFLFGRETQLFITLRDRRINWRFRFIRRPWGVPKGSNAWICEDARESFLHSILLMSLSLQSLFCNWPIILSSNIRPVKIINCPSVRILTYTNRLSSILCVCYIFYDTVKKECYKK